MADWEVFEVEAARYLSNRYAGLGVTVTEQGRSNANLPDIIVEKDDKRIAVETKMARAQSGQFVVNYEGEGDDDFFSLSENCQDSFSYAETAVLDELNSDTEHYLDEMSKQGWSHVRVDEGVVRQCIVEHYRRSKGEEYLITGYLGAREKMLIPMDSASIRDHFDTGAVLRYKPSGTRPIAAYDEGNAQALLDGHLAYLRNSGKYGDVTAGGPLYKDGKHYHVPIAADLDRSDRYFGTEAYYLAPCRCNAGLYRVKRRGRTNNITVVFTLDLKNFTPDAGFEPLDQLLDVKVS